MSQDAIQKGLGDGNVNYDKCLCRILASCVSKPHRRFLWLKLLIIYN